MFTPACEVQNWIALGWGVKASVLDVCVRLRMRLHLTQRCVYIRLQMHTSFADTLHRLKDAFTSVYRCLHLSQMRLHRTQRCAYIRLQMHTSSADTFTSFQRCVYIRLQILHLSQMRLHRIERFAYIRLRMHFVFRGSVYAFL